MGILTTYFDTSMWGHLEAGKAEEVRQLLNSTQVVYSTENVYELLDCSDPELQKRLDQLLDVGSSMWGDFQEAPDIRVPQSTHLVKLTSEQRFEIFHDYASRADTTAPFQDALQKMIGGLSSETHANILQESMAKAIADLNEALEDLDEGEEKERFSLYGRLHILELQAQSKELVSSLSNFDDIRLPELNSAVLGNITGPSSAEKILRLAQEGDTTYMIDTDIPDIPIARDDARKIRPSYDQIRRLARLLFNLRYNREKKNMKDGDRGRRAFRGSHRDIDHLVHASNCSIFITGDKAQSLIAAATYDHLRINTLVLLFNPSDGSVTLVHQMDEKDRNEDTLVISPSM